jgi:hypothetical protein
MFSEGGMKMNKSGIRGRNFGSLLKRIGLQRGLLFGVLIITALFAFEIFNYSTTEYALSDLLGDLRFADISWATILAVAFCGIDFAGIARLFTPEEGADEPAEVWYLFGAWMLAATMNAMLTWWGVSLAILNHQTLGNPVLDRQTLVRIVPVFVAIMVWLIRVLIIGTFSVAGDRLFSLASTQTAGSARQTVRQPAMPPIHRPAPTGIGRNSSQSGAASPLRSASRPEPTYRSVSMSGKPGLGEHQERR